MNRIWETISAAPAEAWVGLVGVIFGALLASFTAWLTSRASLRHLKVQLEHEENLHHRKLSRERLEELYTLVCYWEKVMAMTNFHLASLMVGQIESQEFLDAVKAPDNVADFQRIEMLVGVYGGSLQPIFKDVKVARDELIQAIKGCFEAHKTNNRRGESMALLTSKNTPFNLALEIFKTEIVKAAKEV